MKPVVREAALADKKPSRPGRLLAELAFEDVQVGRSRLLVLPLGLEKIGLALQPETAVDLLAAQLDAAVALHAVGIEQVFQKTFESQSARVRRKSR